MDEKNYKLDETESKLELDNQYNEDKNLLEKEKNPPISIENIISKGFLSYYPISVTISIILILITDGLTMVLISLLVIPIQGKYNLTSFTTELMTASIFFGVALGSISINYLTNKFCRIKLIKIFLFCLLIFHILTAVGNSAVLFIIFRILAGFSIGVIKPIALNIFGEYCPANVRGFSLTVIWIFFSVGHILLGTITINVMPDYDSSKLSIVIMYSSIIILITFLVCLLTLYNSPRYLILKNQIDEAFIILQSMKGNAFTQNEKESILREVKEDNNNEKNQNVNICDIFNSKFKLRTLLLMGIMGAGSSSFYGILNITNLTMKELNYNSWIIEYKDIQYEQLLMATFACIFLIFGSIYVELSQLGRKGVSICFIILTGIFYLFSICFTSLFNTFLVLGYGSNCVFFNVMCTYFIEVYPTWIRDTSSSFLFTCIRIFSFLFQFLYLGLFQVSYTIDYILTVIFCFIGAVLIYYLPIETDGKALDSYIDIKDINDNIKNKSV